MAAAVAGTVYIWDSGLHGRQVEASVRSTGFQGKTVVMQDEAGPEHDANLYKKSDSFQKTLDADIVNIQLAELRQAAKTLGKIEKSGAHDSAINISKGMSKASTVQDLYGQMRRAWAPENASGDYGVQIKNENGAKLLENYANANGLDLKALKSSDPKISGPARGKLQESLLKTVNHAVDDNQDLAAAKKTYDAAVHSVEAKHNSVVIASENAGGLGAEFKRDAGASMATAVSDDFYANPLSNSETTTVGALKGNKIAAYSTRKGAEIYANGDIRTEEKLYDKSDAPTETIVAEGTSFAAPRVAAALAKMHQMNADMSSQEAEDKLLREYSKENGKVRSLDASKLMALH